MEVGAVELSPSASLVGRSALFSSLLACPSLRCGEDGVEEEEERELCQETEALNGKGKGERKRSLGRRSGGERRGCIEE